jgi:dihydrofolate reductase
VTISLIAAVAENGVIGRNGDLPWHLPDDLRWFKQVTMNHAVIVGRRTFESMGKAFPGRRWIVLTRDPSFRADGAEVVADLQAALAIAGSGEIFIGGGSAVFAEALPIADRMYLTAVHAVVEGDTRFPLVDFSKWTLEHEQHHLKDARHAHAFTFRTYARRSDR